METIELTNVYLEYPDELENTSEEVNEETESIVNTTKLSLEELQKKLEETQSLRL